MTLLGSVLCSSLHTFNMKPTGASLLENFAHPPPTSALESPNQFWSSLGDSSLTYEIQFHGVGLASSGDASEEGGSSAGGVAVDGSEGMKKILVGTDFEHHQT